jgi:hypothetical protein
MLRNRVYGRLINILIFLVKLYWLEVEGVRVVHIEEEKQVDLFLSSLFFNDHYSDIQLMRAWAKIYRF